MEGIPDLPNCLRAVTGFRCSETVLRGRTEGMHVIGRRRKARSEGRTTCEGCSLLVDRERGVLSAVVGVETEL